MGTAKKAKYPIGFYICCITYTFERFAFYGTKPLLALFLAKSVAEGGIGISQAEAGEIAVWLTSLTYITPIIGGWLSDRFLGARYAVTLGCILMGIGYFCGWQAHSVPMVWVMILVVAIGTAFFKGNLAAIIGRLFDDQDLLDSAFSIQYSFVNIGSFFGSMICATLYMTTFKQGQMLGFRQVFFLCGVLVLLGGLFFTLSYGKLQGQGIKPFKYLTDTQGNIIGEAKHEKVEKSSAPLTVKQKKNVLGIVLVSAFSIIFWLAYYQQDVVLTFYLEDYINRDLGFFTLSPAHLTTTWNGLLCIFLSLLAAKLWAKLAKRPQGDIPMFGKITLSFLFLGLAYVMLVLTELTRGVGQPAEVQGNVMWIFLFGIFLTIGEICFSPLGNSFVSKYAPKKYLSVLMGVWTVATFFANTINGQFQKIVEKMGIMPVFVTFAIVAFVCAIIMFFLIKPLSKLLTENQN